MKYNEEVFKLKNALSFNLYLSSKELIHHYEKILTEYDLTYTQYVVMMYFWEVGESNLKKVGKVMLLDSSTLTPLVKKLEKKGFLTKTKDTHDERNLIIKLTPKGKKLKSKVIDMPERIGNLLKMSEKERKLLQQQLYNILMKVIAADTKNKD